MAQHLAAKNTWFVPTLTAHAVTGSTDSPRGTAIIARAQEYLASLHGDSGLTFAAPGVRVIKWLRGSTVDDTLDLPAPDSVGAMSVATRASLPVLAGTDFDQSMGLLPGFGIHIELALLVAEGMTPLAALQAATFNPAKALRLADSLGTVTVGKLADLVLLDADPLADITNTTTILGVVANGRYLDRAALDRLLTGAAGD